MYVCMYVLDRHYSVYYLPTLLPHQQLLFYKFYCVLFLV